MLSGDLEVAQYLQSFPKESNLVVSRSLSEPQIYIAFANVWDPVDYQKYAQSWDFQSLDVGLVDQIPDYRLGNYNFKGINADDYTSDSDSILIGKTGEFPGAIKPLKVISYHNGRAAILVVKAAELAKFKRLEGDLRKLFFFFLLARP